MHWSEPSLYGMAWSAALSPVLCPLELIKTRQQLAPERVSTISIFKKIVQEGGGFYKGFFPYLTGRVVKQIWRWPMMMKIPPKINCRPFFKQLITGLCISSTDALLTLLLDRKKIQAMADQNVPLKPWSGLGTYWMKLSVPWCTMLASQNYFRGLFGKKKIAIGFATATVVTLTMAPFDLAHAYRQSQNVSFWQALRRGPFRALGPLFTIRFIENTGVAAVFDLLV